MEWDYGPYEGRRTVDVLVDEPGWSKWTQPIEGGEDVADVGLRADRAIDRILVAAKEEPVIVFAHGHFLSIFVARWLGLEACEGRRFVLETATVSVLGVKRSDHVLRLFNHRCGTDPINR